MLERVLLSALVRRWRHWRRGWEVPLAVLPLCAFVVGLAHLSRPRLESPPSGVVWVAFGSSIVVLLLVYWCALQFVELAFWLVGRAWRAVTWRLDE